MQLDKAIKKRKSVRKFTSKKPNWRKIIECVDSMRYAPMAGGNFTLKFIIVDDQEKIEKISEATQQSFVAEAKYLVLVCSNPSRLKNAYEERGGKYSHQQAGAAIQNFLLKIEEAGLSTCWIGHFIDNTVKRVLKIPEDVDVEGIFPIGYALSKKDKSKEKINLDNILYFDQYKNKKMKPLKTIDSA